MILRRNEVIRRKEESIQNEMNHYTSIVKDVTGKNDLGERIENIKERFQERYGIEIIDQKKEKDVVILNDFEDNNEMESFFDIESSEESLSELKKNDIQIKDETIFYDPELEILSEKEIYSFEDI